MPRDGEATNAVESSKLPLMQRDILGQGGLIKKYRDLDVGAGDWRVIENLPSDGFRLGTEQFRMCP